MLIFFIYAIFISSQSVSASNDVGKIVNGKIANRGDFKFQAAILLKTKYLNGSFFLCGGSLIERHTILTAAHCLHNSESGLIMLGAQDLLANETDVLRMYVNESAFIFHPYFNIAYASYDVALITLPDRVKFNEFIDIVMLPSNHMLDESFSGEVGTVVGFGQYCANCSSSSVLRYTKNRVMNNEECGKFFLGFTPTDYQLCLSTAESNSGSCRGDSGK
jgi:hypothetical protein